MKKSLFIALLTLAACGEDDRNKQAVEAMIEEEVAKRVDNYKRVRMERCYEQALEKASYLADSILILEARMERDSLSKPPIPEKPEKPSIKTVLDSTPIQPLFNPNPPDSLQQPSDSSNIDGK